MTSPIPPPPESPPDSQPFAHAFEALAPTGRDDDYPPFDIEKTSDYHYAVTISVAGFDRKDLDIEVREGQLIICGRKVRAERRVSQAGASPAGSNGYLYKGIAAQAFRQMFRLGAHMAVTGAELKDGLLRVELVRIAPEEQRPQTVAIRSAAAANPSNALTDL